MGLAYYLPFSLTRVSLIYINKKLGLNVNEIILRSQEMDESKLSEEESRVIKKFVTEGKLNGLDLKGEDTLIFGEISRKLAEEQKMFGGRTRVR